jgi:hypothetical protein
LSRLTEDRISQARWEYIGQMDGSRTGHTSRNIPGQMDSLNKRKFTQAPLLHGITAVHRIDRRFWSIQFTKLTRAGISRAWMFKSRP